ncbi:hypothetical protein GCM10010313_81510 [Streptomyces violarus]|uniref:Uncharacterized protein n=1 Tax=Streptomyces violarus TaxID=67380 RepID=A0A7W5F6I6_9ACTN|nr:hypothetical protein [Streptomyces violarus]MBB3081708.1 hypothetical protein [Streptomyces violarus]GHD34717.1 hypothetical protein GCM10010313_81510 [Streptomyces violarus]
MTGIQYGIASPSRLDDVEPLERLNRRAAEAVIADSRTQWPDVYLVQRTDGDDWQPSSGAVSRTTEQRPA